MKHSPFFRQAELMIKVLPLVAKETGFALKGGTAINLFVRDFPRLSVDIDITYLPIEPRNISLPKISSALGRIKTSVEREINSARVHASKISNPDRINKLVISTEEAQIKIEPNEIIRGTVFPPSKRTLVPVAEELFEMSATINTLSIADLYGGKICAALDRGHPRDWFDIMVLMENEGITDDVRKAFVLYLASHNRPMAELLDPIQPDFRKAFEKEFQGMTRNPVSYDELVEARSMALQNIRKSLTREEREFLLSIKMETPKWDLIGIEGIDKLPAIQWKLTNLKKMEIGKKKIALEKLSKILEI